MKEKTLVFALCLLLAVPMIMMDSGGQGVERVMVKTSVELTPAVVQQLSAFAVSVNFVFGEIDAVAMSVTKANLARLKQLDIVEWVEIDREVRVLGDHSGGMLTWNLDMVNAEVAHEEEYFGSDVYVAVLDTGLVPHWRDYFHEETIAIEYATAFLSAEGTEVPGEAWDSDTHSHGTHVTSTVLGYWLKPLDRSISGVAPKCRVIPVKVLTNQGFGWTSAVVAGILYVADLKESGEIPGPIVISMSLGAKVPSRVEYDAILDAIDAGVIVVAAAGNEGEAGMGWPGAYPEVISVGASGWTKEWQPVVDTTPNGTWWYALDVPEEKTEIVKQTYITWWSSREKPLTEELKEEYPWLPEPELDVVAPGSWIVGPYMPYGVAHPPVRPVPFVPGEYYFVGGTSMSTPHVSGIIALMLSINPDLTQADVEDILKTTALPIPAGSAEVFYPDPELGWGYSTFTWCEDATGAGLVQADDAIVAVP